MQRGDRRCPRASALVLAGALAVLVRAPAARAESPRAGVDLVWRAPAECPTREFVEGRIRELLGPAAERASHLHAQGEIVRSKGRYRLVLRLLESGASGERVIEADSCADLAGAAAVALGLLIRVELESREQEATGSPPGVKESTQSVQPAATGDEGMRAPAPKPVEPERTSSDAEGSPGNVDGEESSVRAILHAPWIGLGVGALPRAYGTLGIALGVRLPRWDALIGGRASLPQTTWSNGPPRYGAELQLVTIELRACYRFGTGTLEAGPCVLASVDRIAARGVGDEVESRRAQAFVPGAGVGAFGRWRWTRAVGLTVSLGAEVEASRPRLIVDGLEELEQFAPFGFAAGTGVEWLW